jgi:hypothetical protein
MFILTKRLQLTYPCTIQVTHLPYTAVSLLEPMDNSSASSPLSEF